MLTYIVLSIDTLSSGRQLDLSWIDVDSLLASITVVKQTPKNEKWMVFDLGNNIHEFVETNKKIFLQFKAKPLLESSISGSASNSQTVSRSSTLNSIVYVLQPWSKYYENF